MSLLFGNVNHRHNADTRPASMVNFNPTQQRTYLCRKCQREFKSYEGMPKVKQGSAIGYCQEHKPVPAKGEN